MKEVLTWCGIAFCVTQSAMFSGLNLAFFSVSRLRLLALDRQGNKDAAKVLQMRKDSNFLLTTILWGNVGINVLLTLLSNSVLAGVAAFLFSTVIITAFGEIVPQAYFSRHALRTASLLAPVLRIYQLLLYPVTKPSALLLDLWLGKESINYFREAELREILREHAEADNDIGHVEGRGAVNFLALDDIRIADGGIPLAPESLVRIEFKDGKPRFPAFRPDRSDPFLKDIDRSGKKWVVLVDHTDTPRLVLDANGFLRDMFLSSHDTKISDYCYEPIVVTDDKTTLGDIIPRFHVIPDYPDDSLIDHDIVLLWSKQKRIMTGDDILGRLMHGIVRRDPASPNGLLGGQGR